jgi:hypothetical protein
MHEPRLRALETLAITYAHEFRDSVPRCKNWMWYGSGPDGTGIRERLLRIIPGGSDYEIAERHLYAILPDCRQCACRENSHR